LLLSQAPILSKLDKHEEGNACSRISRSNHSKVTKHTSSSCLQLCGDTTTLTLIAYTFPHSLLPTGAPPPQSGGTGDFLVSSAAAAAANFRTNMLREVCTTLCL